MNSYKLTWSLKSPYSTPLQSDTVFGHLAWAMVYLYGKQRLEQALAILKERPAFVCSSLFPQGLLPIPKIPFTMLLKERWCKQHGNTPDSWIAWSELLKKLKKLDYLPAQMLTSPDSLFDWWSIIEYILSNEDASHKQFQKATIFHNTINRLTATTDESTGGPFAEVVSWSAKHSLFESWINLENEILSFEELEELVAYISDSGFGKNKSTGRGRMKISVQPAKWELDAEKANAWMLLSNAVPAASDSTDCLYASLAKFPRLGGSFAITDTPYKKPVFVFTPGTVFMGKRPQGVLLQNIHPLRKEVVQNLYAFSIPIYTKEAI